MGSKRNKTKQAQRNVQDMPAKASTPTAGWCTLRVPALRRHVFASPRSAVAGFVAWAFMALIMIGYIAFRIEATLNARQPDEHRSAHSSPSLTQPRSLDFN